MKKSGEMTDLQRQALEHVERTRAEGLLLSAYAKAHRISARQVYDSTAMLRRRGLPPTGCTPSKKFVTVKMAAPLPPSGGMVSRIVVHMGRATCPTFRTSLT